jgi:ribosomal protein L11 methyltransferase
MMTWIEVKVVFNFNDRQLAVDLISDLFYDLDLKGVVVEESQVEGFEDWGCHADIPENDAIIGYLPDDDTLRKKRKTIEEGLARLEKKIGIQYRIFYGDVDETDWAESWKAYFRPEKITDRIVVKPTWRDYLHNEKEIVLEIDPGMAFGTGTHPTTRMCIALIEKYLKKSDTFLDVGTGSGILMIAAAKLGASKILGTDNDAVAAKIARKNLIHNQIPESVFTIITGDLVDGITQRFNLSAANLTTKAVSILLENIPKMLVKDGIFICSGILFVDKNKILDNVKYAGLQIIEILVDEDWIALASRRV